MAVSIYLKKADLKTNINAEALTTITRSDDSIIEEGIEAAIDYAKSKLNRYNLSALFGVEPSTPPTVKSAQLKKAVKDMAVFNICSLNNVNYDMATLNTLNENAMKWLQEVQGSKAIPEGWPERDTKNNTFPEGNQVSAFYNERNTNRI